MKRKKRRRAAVSEDEPIASRPTGETVGEAKWAALRELERRFPGLDRDVGPVRGRLRGRARPARRRLRAGAGARDASTGRARRRRGAPPRGRERAAARARARAARARSPHALGVDCRVEVDEDGRDDHGDRAPASDLGAADRPARPDDRRDPVPRRTRSLARGGDDRARRSSSTPPATASAARERSRRSRCAAPSRRVRTGERVELEPMSATERKIVHLRLKDVRRRRRRTSEGDEPNRYVVVAPRRVTGRPGSRAGLLETPGLTVAPRSGAEARAGAARGLAAAVPLVERLARPDRRRRLRRRRARDPARARAARTGRSSLLEAQRRKCAFLERVGAAERARRLRPRRGAGRRTGPASPLAKALAPPPVAAEWCLPLVRPGGAVVLCGRAERRRSTAVARVAALLGGGARRGARPGLLVLREARRRRRRAFRAAPGWPRKRPLA